MYPQGLAPAHTHGGTLTEVHTVHTHGGTLTEVHASAHSQVHSRKCTLTEVYSQRHMPQGAHIQEHVQNTLKEVQAQSTNSSLQEHTDTHTNTRVHVIYPFLSRLAQPVYQAGL